MLDFVWVGLAVEALLRAGACAEFGPINVANGTGTSLQDLATRIHEVTGATSSIRLEPARPAEVTRFVADSARMRSVLGLHPDADPLSHLRDLVTGTSLRGSIEPPDA